jgi:hypothetical protein
VAELYYRSINGGSRKSPPAPSSWCETQVEKVPSFLSVKVNFLKKKSQTICICWVIFECSSCE